MDGGTSKGEKAPRNDIGMPNVLGTKTTPKPFTIRTYRTSTWYDTAATGSYTRSVLV